METPIPILSLLAASLFAVGFYLFKMHRDARQSPPISLKGGAPPALPRQETVLAVSAPGLLRKYEQRKTRAIAVGIASLVAFLACAFYFLSRGFEHFDPGLSTIMRVAIVAAPLGALALLAYTSVITLLHNQFEMDLFGGSKEKHLVLTKHGIDCFIGLVDEPFRSQMRRNHQHFLHVPWISISAWVVESDENGGGDRRASTYYKLSFHHQEPELFILRQYLTHKETEILEEARRFLCCPLEIRDSA